MKLGLHRLVFRGNPKSPTYQLSQTFEISLRYLSKFRKQDKRKYATLNEDSVQGSNTEASELKVAVSPMCSDSIEELQVLSTNDMDVD